MAQTPEFKYAPMFQLGKDETEYYLLSKEGISVSEFEGNEILKVSPEALTMLANTAFRDVNFLLRREHNEQVAKILTDPNASDNDKYVALTFLRNAEVAAKGKRPSFTAKRDNTFGRAFVMRRRSLKVCTKLTLKRT